MALRSGLLLLLLLGPPGLALAEGASDIETARRAHGLASDVMSPFCPGRTLADCPSPDAAAVREEVRALLASGVSEGEVRSRLESRFGDAVRGVPRSVWGWALPIVALALGALGVALALRRLSVRGGAPVGSTPEVPLDPEIEAELDRTLRDEGL